MNKNFVFLALALFFGSSIAQNANECSNQVFWLNNYYYTLVRAETYANTTAIVDTLRKFQGLQKTIPQHCRNTLSQGRETAAKKSAAQQFEREWRALAKLNNEVLAEAETYAQNRKGWKELRARLLTLDQQFAKTFLLYSQILQVSFADSNNKNCTGWLSNLKSVSNQRSGVDTERMTKFASEAIRYCLTN
eukprot:TRINITY_DN0_c1256_g1_i2.p1 TRINITY_DN0_c1256_g1~~TRINITY_DN0_c1256_g1_i2.p1  ORF type:complete len:191 (+),score=63.95 TRINITY_DN0_c1256_g1_i2:40-612(+)